MVLQREGRGATGGWAMRLHRAGHGATEGGPWYYKGRAMVLQRKGHGTTKGGPRCYRGKATVLQREGHIARDAFFVHVDVCIMKPEETVAIY